MVLRLCTHIPWLKCRLLVSNISQVKNTNTWGFGPGATLHEIRYPQGCIVDGQLICKNCELSMGPISTNINVMSLCAQALRVSKLDRHIREKCVPNNK